MKPIIQLTISGLNPEQAMAVSMLLQKMGGNETGAVAATPAPAKRGRKPKQEVAEEIEEEEVEEPSEDVEEEAEEPAEDDAEDGEDFEEEETEEEESDTIGEADLKKLKAALKAFSDKNGKAKAVKTLMKFAKTSAEVAKADFPKLMKALK